MEREQGPFDPPDTRRNSWESFQEGRMSEVDTLVYQRIVMAGHSGICCFEIEAACNLLHQTASSSITRLKKARLVEDSGHRRLTPSGKPAAAWRQVRND